MNFTHGTQRRPTPPTWHIRAQQRVKARQDATRARLDRFITSAQTTAYTPYCFADLPQDAYGRTLDGHGETPWRPAPWAMTEAA